MSFFDYNIDTQEVVKMEKELQARFIGLWQKYFNRAELPLAFYYTADAGQGGEVVRGSGKGCMMADIVKVRQGTTVVFDVNSVGCPGGKKYLGYADKLMPNFEHFLSCGIPGKMEGERYKKTPELVAELLQRWPRFKAPAPYLVFKRWDLLKENESPQVVVFFAKPDVLSGLYTLANFDVADPDGVIAPMGSGCSSIIQNPFLQGESAIPRAVIGMFDPSARPFVAADELAFSVPFNKFQAMVGNMEESFLTTPTWTEIQKRISLSSASGF
jgi:uncharacterized protein (DUF169 family)